MVTVLPASGRTTWARRSQLYRCPVCTAELESDHIAYRCPAGHAYDRSREGYVNLLLRPPRNRASGDSLEMIHARRRFLEGGHFEDLRRAVLGGLGAGSVLDIGCGEGYYSRPLTEGPDRPWIGAIDVSRPAIRLASRRTGRPGRIAYAVANAFSLPVVSGSIDNALSIFGPVAPGEIERVLSPTGRVVVAAPGPAHLLELKELLLAEARRHELRYPLEDDTRFEPLHQQRVTCSLGLDRAEVEALIDMTPYRWQIPAERKGWREELAPMEVTADFLVVVLGRAR